MPPKNRKPVSRWSMHPELHGDVSRLLAEDDLLFSFYKNDTDSESIRDYDTNIMGRFVCHNQKCTSHGWSSKMIAITVRLYSRQRYNARVYHQRCQQCNAISKPHLNDTYAERVAYRLKKWHGVEMEAPEYGGHSERPHQSELCEGCRAGHCNRA